MEKFIENVCPEKNVENNKKFIVMTLADLGALHAGAIVGLGVSEGELNIWLKSRPKISR